MGRTAKYGGRGGARVKSGRTTSKWRQILQEESLDILHTLLGTAGCDWAMVVTQQPITLTADRVKITDQVTVSYDNGRPVYQTNRLQSVDNDECDEWRLQFPAGTQFHVAPQRSAEQTQHRAFVKDYTLNGVNGQLTFMVGGAVTHTPYRDPYSGF